MFDLGPRRMRGDGTAAVPPIPATFRLALDTLSASGSVGNLWRLAARDLQAHAVTSSGTPPNPALPPLVPEDLDPAAGVDGGPIGDE